MMARVTRMYPRCRRPSQKNRIVDTFTRRSRGENEMKKEGGDPTINIMWKLERKRGWRNDDDDDDDDRATMMFPEDGESKGGGTTREEVLFTNYNI